MIDARKTVPTVAVLEIRQQIEKIYFYFLFCYFFVIFLPCFVLTWAIFLKKNCIYFMFTNFGIPDIERRKRKRNLLIRQPQGSLSESTDTLYLF